MLLLCIDDEVTTVSLQFGRVVEIVDSVITILRDDGTIYYASVDAVIRVRRGEDTFVVERRRNGAARLFPYETSWAQREFIRYMANRTYDRLSQNRSAAGN